jgi:hypothetical protein
MRRGTWVVESLPKNLFPLVRFEKLNLLICDYLARQALEQVDFVGSTTMDLQELVMFEVFLAYYLVVFSCHSAGDDAS